jgi:hypothetical protein
MPDYFYSYYSYFLKFWGRIKPLTAALPLLALGGHCTHKHRGGTGCVIYPSPPPPLPSLVHFFIFFRRNFWTVRDSSGHVSQPAVVTRSPRAPKTCTVTSRTDLNDGVQFLTNRGYCHPAYIVASAAHVTVSKTISRGRMAI